MILTQISIGIGLSMDAVAVSICESASMSSIKRRNLLIMSLIFGVMQGGMMLIGGLIGSQFEHIIADYGYWLAFILLFLIGLNMVKSSMYAHDHDACVYRRFTWKSTILLGVATSIDALVAGISIVFTGMSLIQTSIIVGAITTALCFIGSVFGVYFGSMYKNKASLLGGCVLILMAIRIIIEHY